MKSILRPYTMVLICTISVLVSRVGWADEDDVKYLAKSKPWLRLLHYQPTWSGWASELDGSEFFFAPDGQINPLSELTASMAAMSDGRRQIGRLKLHPQCAFPERYRFLKAHTHLKVADVSCPKFDEFVERFHDPQGASIVFSTAYPNNPASMFGHTFIKIQSKNKSELLDYGINFAAEVPGDENPFAFMYFGLFGGYHGRWSLEPYFNKVNEYVNAESRDLWEYELNLTPQETQRLIAHIWELEVSSYFDYFFLDENCSYQVLRALEGVKPDWTFTDGLLSVIPGETIKLLYNQPGAVRGTSFRSSLFHQLQDNFAALSEQERKVFADLNNVKSAPPPAGAVTTPTLNAALIQARYIRQRAKNKISPEQQKRSDYLFSLRAKQKDSPPPVPENPAYRLTEPSLGHDARMLSIFSGASENWKSPNKAIYGFKLRTAYHDFMSNDKGYSPFSEIEFPWVEAQVRDSRFTFRQIGIVSSTSLFPITPYEKQLSWRAKVFLDRDLTGRCDGCLIQKIEGGGGYTIGGAKYRAYLFGIGEAQFQSRLPDGYLSRPGVEVAGIWNPTPNYKTRAQWRTLWDFHASFANALHETELKWDHSWSLSRNQEIRQSSLWTYVAKHGEPRTIEFRLDFVQYFN